MSRPRNSLGRIRRSLTALFSVAYLAAQFAGFAHLAFVEHQTCAEHGELVHPSRLIAHRLAASTPTGHSSASSSTPQTAEGDDHDHCLLCTAARTHAILHAGPPQIGALTAVPVASPPGQERESWIERARYRLAPKNSPPV